MDIPLPDEPLLRVFDVEVTQRVACKDDCLGLAPRLRAQDILELECVNGCTALQELQRSYAVATERRAILLDQVVVAMVGVGCPEGTPPGQGLVWMVGSVELDQDYLRIPFVRLSRLILSQIGLEYSRLFNYVDAGNGGSVAWLRWLGFRMVCLHRQFGAGRRPFWEFELLRQLRHARPMEGSGVCPAEGLS